jgi:hypothetical protein
VTEIATEAVAIHKQRATRRRAEVTQATGVDAGRGVRDTRPSRAAPPSARPAPSPGRKRGPGGSGLQIKSLNGPHTGALFAEYFAAVLIIVLALFTESATKGYPATISKVMMRLTALTMVFFVLFLMQGSKRGGQAAIWLGLMIDLGVIFAAAQEQLFSTVATMVSGKGLTSQGVTLDSTGGLSSGGGTGLQVPAQPTGVTLPDE